MMRKIEADSAGGIVYLWSPAPASVRRACHKIRGWVKRSAPTATFWGQGKTDGMREKTRCKLAYQVSGSLVNNDKRKTARR